LRECRGLFQSFATVKPTLEGILAFASNYGNLKDHCGLQEWLTEIEAMRQAVSVWKYLNKFDEEKVTLRRHFQWKKGYRDEMLVVYDSHPESPEFHPVHVIASETSADGLWEELKNNNVFVAASCYLMQAINKHMNANAISVLVWSKETKTLNRVFVPKNLLGALWLQFEDAVTGNRKYRECLECHQWFPVSRDAGRSDKTYCGNACRSKAYRQRQGRAREMWGGGKGNSIKEIAEQLDVNERTVQGWVSQQRKRKEK